MAARKKTKAPTNTRTKGRAKKAAPKRTRGRPAHRPTKASRAQVRLLAGYGLTRPMIGRVVGISDETLRKHYPDDLAEGDATAQSELLRTAYQQAIGAPAEYDKKGKLLREEIKPDRTILIFLLKTRCGLTEPAREMKIGGIPDAAPIKQEATTLVREIDDPERHTPAELVRWYRDALQVAASIH